MWMFDYINKIRALRNEAAEHNMLHIAEILDDAIMLCNNFAAFSRLYDIIMMSLHGDGLKSKNVVLFPPNRIKTLILNDEGIDDKIQ